MKDYTVYFEIYGKKMKATVKAFNEDGARLIIKDKLIIHKVETPHPFGNSFSDFIDILSGKKKPK